MENVYPFNDNAFKNDVTTTKAYRIRVKLNNKEKLSREEKNYITTECHHNCFFKTSIPILGWRISFNDVLKTYLVKQYDRWTEYNAMDKTSLRNMISGKIDKIVEIFY